MVIDRKEQHRFYRKKKQHIRTKHSNALIWHYRGRVITNFNIFTFQRTLLFIKLSVTIEKAVSGLL